MDRLIFAGIYRLDPTILNALPIVKPETVMEWHRVGSDRLALEAEVPWQPTNRAAGDTQAYSRDEHRQSTNALTTVLCSASDTPSRAAVVHEISPRGTDAFVLGKGCAGLSRR
jgi:hypothetical protein